jgi:1,4-dihydroxy-2-naphthoate octaprenyltransferase
MRWGRTQVAVLESLALLAALAISPWFAGLLAGAVVYGIAYSGGPVYAGGRPLVSQMFWIVLWPGMYAGVALVMGGRLERGLLYVAGVILFMGVAETLAKDLRDLSNDTRAGKRTTPVAIGAGVAAGVAAVAFALGSLGLVGASLFAPHWNPGLTVALAVVLGLWCGRAGLLARQMTQAYSKQAARAMHVGAIRVFLVVNALFLTGLTG